jgi:hypothetical protein
MASLSNYLKNKLLDHSLGIAAYTMPTTMYLGLFLTDPTAANTGIEVSGYGYARQATTFSASSSGTSSNTSTEVFTASGGSFGRIKYIGLFDASTSGNLLWFGPVHVPRRVDSGESLSFIPGSIDLTLG